MKIIFIKKLTFQQYTNVNYILRGMEIPKGEHIIKFTFEPSVIKTGNTISLISYALMLLISISWFFITRKNKPLYKFKFN